jgi:peptidyl-tRNA hydrolase, PTH1 family
MTSIIVGLGNTGERYAATRHNVGYEAVGRAASELGAIMESDHRYYRWARADTESGRVVLVWPTTYMNRSGLAVAELLERFPASPSDIMVVTDDFNLTLGRIRVRAGGSDGGQKGLRSIAEVLDTEEFPRCRIGIGPLPEGADPVEFVLGRFTLPESEIIEKSIAVAAKAVIFATHRPIDEVMAQFNNTNPALPEQP